MTIPPLVFVRHGETDWNVGGRLQGQTDIPLNARGRDQAAAVGRALAAVPGLPEMRFLSSPLLRARETMRRMRAALGLDPEDHGIDGRLAEMSFGRWEGSTFAEIRAREPAEMKARDAARWSHRPPGGESYEDLSARVGAAIGELSGPTVLVSHGGVARVVLASFGGAERDRLPELHIRQGRALIIEDGAWRWG
jgi:broad specificity phosphatase PhoE